MAGLSIGNGDAESQAGDRVEYPPLRNIFSLTLKKKSVKEMLEALGPTEGKGNCPPGKNQAERGRAERGAHLGRGRGANGQGDRADAPCHVSQYASSWAAGKGNMTRQNACLLSYAALE